MSNQSKQVTCLGLLLLIHSAAHKALSGSHANPAVNGLLRLSALFLMLAICWPLAWKAFGAVSTLLIVTIGVVVVIRTVLWWRRRRL